MPSHFSGAGGGICKRGQGGKGSKPPSAGVRRSAACSSPHEASHFTLRAAAATRLFLSAPHPACQVILRIVHHALRPGAPGSAWSRDGCARRHTPAAQPRQHSAAQLQPGRRARSTAVGRRGSTCLLQQLFRPDLWTVLVAGVVLDDACSIMHMGGQAGWGMVAPLAVRLPPRSCAPRWAWRGNVACNEAALASGHQQVRPGSVRASSSCKRHALPLCRSRRSPDGGAPAPLSAQLQALPAHLQRGRSPGGSPRLPHRTGEPAWRGGGRATAVGQRAPRPSAARRARLHPPASRPPFRAALATASPCAMLPARDVPPACLSPCTRTHRRLPRPSPPHSSSTALRPNLPCPAHQTWPPLP